MPELGRNDPCHCGSGKKYKKCCEAKDATKAHTTLEKNWTEAEKKFEKEKEKEEESNKSDSDKPAAAVMNKKPESSKMHIPKHQSASTPKYTMPRKSGGGA